MNASRFSPELRSGVFYFTLYMSGGAAVAYGGIWFADQGLTATEIGVVNALPVLIMLALNLVVGRIADRATDWRQVIVLGAIAGGVVPIGLFFVSGFWGILIVWTLAALPIAAIGPVFDAATLRMTRRNGTDFGAVRTWGTIGFMLVIFLTGYLVTLFGGGIFVGFFVALALLRMAVALFLPKFRAPLVHGDAKPAAVGAVHLVEIMKPWFLLPLVGFAMVYATHLVFNGFAAIAWKEQGIDEGVIGILIGIGAFAEATMIFVFARFLKRFPARVVILGAALTATLRWIVMGYAPPVEVLVLLQLLHAFTFAMGYMGCIHFIANWTSDDIAAEAQSFFQVLQQGMSVVALVGFGWLFGFMGDQAYFAAGIFAFLGGIQIWLSLKLRQPKAD